MLPPLDTTMAVWWPQELGCNAYVAEILNYYLLLSTGEGAVVVARKMVSKVYAEVVI